MGTKMGTYLFVGFSNHQFCNQYKGPKPNLYGRYIDDHALVFTTNLQAHSSLLYSSSHPINVKNSIPFQQFLSLLCRDESDFCDKSEATCQVFGKRGYPVSFVQAGHHRAQQIDRQSALQTAHLKNCTLLQNDSETGTTSSRPSLI